MLSDWDNLSYNRLAVFDRFTGNEDLKNVKPYNENYLDFSKPRSMRVLASENYPEGCIVSRQTGERFCLKRVNALVTRYLRSFMAMRLKLKHL